MTDARELGDLIGQVRGAIMRATVRPAYTRPAPDPAVVGPEVAGADPVVVPEQLVIRPDLSTLPDELVSPDGQPVIPAIVAWLWAATQQREAQQLRVATGRTVVNSGPVRAVGSTFDVPVLFDEPAAVAPSGGWVQQTQPLALLGMSTARIKPGTLTTTGCTVEVKAIGPAPLVLSVGTQLLVEAVCLYWWAPPFVPSTP